MTIRLRIASWKPKRTGMGIETIVFVEGAILLACDQNVLNGIGPQNWRWRFKIICIEHPGIECQPRSRQPAKLMKYAAPGLRTIQKLLQVHLAGFLLSSNSHYAT